MSDERIEAGLLESHFIESYEGYDFVGDLSFYYFRAKLARDIGPFREGTIHDVQISLESMKLEVMDSKGKGVLESIDLQLVEKIEIRSSVKELKDATADTINS